VLRHLVRKVLSPLNYDVVRADEIDEEGLITNQIIGHLLKDDLVVADLTGNNPNVFYEVAVRHAVNKPIVHLITAGETIPFDVAHMRAVTYALDDPDLLEEAQDELARKVAAIREGDGKAAPNPVTAGRDVAILRESDTPELREAGDVLAALNEISDQLRAMERRQASPATRRTPSEPSRHAALTVIEKEVRHLGKTSTIPTTILLLLWDRGPTRLAVLADEVPADKSTISRHLRTLAERNMAERQGDLWDLSDGFRDWVTRRA
jgi:hypothetical protein